MAELLSIFDSGLCCRPCHDLQRDRPTSLSGWIRSTTTTGRRTSLLVWYVTLKVTSEVTEVTKDKFTQGWIHKMTSLQFITSNRGKTEMFNTKSKHYLAIISVIFQQHGRKGRNPGKIRIFPEMVSSERNNDQIFITQPNSDRYFGISRRRGDVEF